MIKVYLIFQPLLLHKLCVKRSYDMINKVSKKGVRALVNELRSPNILNNYKY